jgi:hypothetical protein
MASSYDPSLSLLSQQPRQGWVLTALIVVAIHLGAIAFVLFYSPAEPQLKKKAKVIVQTVQLNSQQRIQLTTPVPPRPLPEAGTKEQNEKVAAAPEVSPAKPKAPPPPAKSEQKEVKKTELTQPVQKPEAVKKTAAPAKPAPANVAKPKAPAQPQKKQVDEKAELEKKKQQREKAETEKLNRKKAEEEKVKQERLAVALGALGKSKQSREQMHHQPDRTSLEQVADPKAIESLSIDVWLSDPGEKGDTWGVQEVNYRDQVGKTLKSELKLPEYGAVTMRLTLDHLGKVIKVEIVNSQSSKNRAYVEKNIPMLSFPPFGQQFKGELQCTFSFILKNHS